MRPTDFNRQELEVDEDAAYLFWTVVQAVRDYVFYSPNNPKHRDNSCYRLAKSWITNPEFVAQWGDVEDALCFTFGEALEMLGVQSENVNVFRSTIRKARDASTQEERSQIVVNAYSELHFHDNEPDPFWRNYNLQMERQLKIINPTTGPRRTHLVFS